jgi:hypothetical protein
VPNTEDATTLVYIPKPAEMSALTDKPDLEDSGTALVAWVLRRIHLETASQLFTVWEVEWEREKDKWLAGVNSNYERPMMVKSKW